jgi:hypothetical protein
VCLLAMPAAAAEKTGKTERTFTVTAPARLIVENVWGGIQVAAASGNSIRVDVDERWVGDTQADLDRALKEVKLEMTQEASTVKVRVDMPRCEGGRDYEAHFNFRIQVPPDTALELNTVNDGDIRAEGTRGEFRVRNVNGNIDLTDISGSGSAHTVNGPVRVSFRENPAGASSFKTVNGALELAFQPNLAADFRMKTLNGEGWSDFEYQNLPAKVEAGARQGSRFVYRGRGGTGVRVGAGGPEITAETLNGPIRIIKRGK